MRVDEPGGDFFTALLRGVVEEGNALKANKVLSGAVIGVEEVLQVGHIVFGEGAKGGEHIHVVGDAAGGLLAVLTDRGCARRVVVEGSREEDAAGPGFVASVYICAWVGRVIMSKAYDTTFKRRAL